MGREPRVGDGAWFLQGERLFIQSVFAVSPTQDDPETSSVRMLFFDKGNYEDVVHRSRLPVYSDMLAVSASRSRHVFLEIPRLSFQIFALSYLIWNLHVFQSLIQLFQPSCPQKRTWLWSDHVRDSLSLAGSFQAYELRPNFA